VEEMQVLADGYLFEVAYIGQHRMKTTNKTEVTMRRLPKLPSEIKYDVLLKLPVKSLVRFKYVFKT
jgi:hypothetical protein